MKGSLPTPMGLAAATHSRSLPAPFLKRLARGSFSLAGHRSVKVLTLCFGIWGSFHAAELDLTKLPPAATRQIDFAKDIQPILTESCYGCHGPKKQEAQIGRASGRER